MKVELNVSTGMRIEKIPISDSESGRREKQRAKYIWRCEICGRCLCSKRSYSEHKNTHNAARPFKCESCDYAAASQMTLRRHTLRQHVPRSHWHYPCPYCEQAFVEPTSYQAHLRHKHAGYSGTFGCDKCDYKTLSSKNFVDHIFKHGNVRPKKRPPYKTIKDFTDRETICKCLVDDELGVGWGQQPAEMDVDEQALSLRRLASAEQERKRRGMPVIAAIWSAPRNQQTRLRPVGDRSMGPVSPSGLGQSLGFARSRSGAAGISTNYDHKYQTSQTASSGLPSSSRSVERMPRRSMTTNISDGWRRAAPILPNDHSKRQSSLLQDLPSTSSVEQGCPVPEAECYVEVVTAPEGDTKTAVELVDGEHDGGDNTDSGSENEDVDGDEDDDDSASCSSDNSVEIGLRLTALTADIEMGPSSEIPYVGHGDQECQDLGNDVLPDGQVDFDLD